MILSHQSIRGKLGSYCLTADAKHRAVDRAIARVQRSLDRACGAKRIRRLESRIERLALIRGQIAAEKME